MNAISNRHAALLAAINTFDALKGVNRTVTDEPATYVLATATQYLTFLEGREPPHAQPQASHLALVA